MKVNFKPLALAAAVAATTAGTAGVVNAQEVGKLATRGDFALIPYYTVQKDWVTGIHITNTSPSKQHKREIQKELQSERQKGSI